MPSLRPSITVSPYPKPGPEGGRLIRSVIGFLKTQNLKLPLTSHILIATSGGSDSVGLAHLLIHFGRRIIPRSHVSLLHVNHGWRGEESNSDEEFVKELGRKWGVPVISHRLKPPAAHSGNSWEEEARDARKVIYVQEAKQRKALVFTAHQADDLAETVLWRLFTGAARTHGGGVAFRHGVEIRPFLETRKVMIQAYLKEVNQTYREDSTNLSDRFLRSRMRSLLMPAVEKLFPKAIEHLVRLALNAQKESVSKDLAPQALLLRAAGIKARRSHLELVLEKWAAEEGTGEVHLPGGWKLTREKWARKKPKLGSEVSPSGQKVMSERWILERG